MSELDIVAPTTPQVHDQMLDLVAKVFSHHGYYAFLEHCRNGYIDNSHYDASVSRVGMVGPEAVSHWGVWDYQMRIGHCAVRCGGIGVVASAATHRKQGYLRQTAVESLAAMRQAGYDLSVLFGIQDFYHRLEYVRAWPNTLWTIALPQLEQGLISRDGRPASPQELQALEPQLPVLWPFKPGPRKDLDRLYNKTHAGLTGTAVRPTFSQARGANWLGGQQPQGFLWGDKEERPAGYVLILTEGGKLHLQDWAGPAQTALAAIVRLARQHQCKEVSVFALPARSELARLLRRMSCRVECNLSRCGGPMVRIVNLRTTLEKIAPELSRRLASSPLADWQGQLTIAANSETVTLDLARGRVSVSPAAKGSKHAIRGNEHVARLLIGSDSPAEVADAGRIRLSGDARKLCEVLFPDQQPMLMTWDHM